MGSHSTSDDQEQYQDMEQVEYWRRNLYPATRLKLYLIEKEIWDEEKEEELAKRVDREIKVCERLSGTYSGVKTASHTGHCLINLVNAGKLKLNCIQSIWVAGQEW